MELNIYVLIAIAWLVIFTLKVAKDSGTIHKENKDLYPCLPTIPEHPRTLKGLLMQQRTVNVERTAKQHFGSYAGCNLQPVSNGVINREWMV